jgi:aspartate racemase
MASSSLEHEESIGRCLGLVGGLGVGAAVHYYQELVKAHVALARVPNLVIIHADVKRVLHLASTGETAQLATYLTQHLRSLSLAGAQIAAIPAVTPHICFPELLKMSPMPLVSLVREIGREVERRGFRRIALFGTRVTINTSMFGQLSGVEIVPPRPDKVESIHSTYLEIVAAGGGSEQNYQSLRSIAHNLCQREHVDAIVLAGTELSLLFNESSIDFPHVDGARVHLRAIMRELAEPA